MVELKEVPGTPFSPCLESLGLPSVPSRTSGWGGLWDSRGVVGLREVPGTPFSPCQESLGLTFSPLQDQWMGRTVGQQRCGGTEGSPWDSL